MNFGMEREEEVDGRWIAEIPQLPGVLCYGKTAAFQLNPVTAA